VGAPHDQQIAAIGLVQLPDAGEGLFAGDARGVLPRQLVVAERRGHDVLWDGVHLVGERVAGSLGPRRGHRLPRAAPEQERFGFVHRVGEGAAYHLRIEERLRPAAVGEATVGVFVGPAWRLHYAVQAHELSDHDAHGIRSSSVAGGTASQTLAPFQNHRAPSRGGGLVAQSH